MIIPIIHNGRIITVLTIIISIIILSIAACDLFCSKCFVHSAWPGKWAREKVPYLRKKSIKHQSKIEQKSNNNRLETYEKSIDLEFRGQKPKRCQYRIHKGSRKLVFWMLSWGQVAFRIHFKVASIFDFVSDRVLEPLGLDFGGMLASKIDSQTKPKIEL